jgi:hypothetical protein
MTKKRIREIKKVIKDAGLDCLHIRQKKHLKILVGDGNIEFEVMASVTPYAGETSLKVFRRDLLRLYDEAQS